MLQKSTISPGAPRKPSMDFLRMREEAMEVIRQLAGDTAGGGWTDHNLHDPGITILEQLCYALTDLGYRLDFSVPELLADAMDAEQQTIAWKPGTDPDDPPTLPGMPGMAEALPTAPVTLDDWRRVILDIDGIRSIAILEAEDAQPRLYFDAVKNEVYTRKNPDGALKPIQIRGLYNMFTDTEEGHYQETSRQLRAAFHAQRPAGEDLQQLTQLQPAPITLVAELELMAGSNPEEILAEIFLRVDHYLSPQARFHTRAALETAGLTNEALMDGPLLKGGFLKSADLGDSVPKNVFYLSRIIEQVFAVKGVQEVRALRLKGKDAQVSLKDGVNYWVPLLSTGMVPRLDPDTAMVTVRIDGVVKAVDGAKVRTLFEARRKQLTVRHISEQTQLPARARDRKVASYQSVQHQFPDNYGINARGLPQGSSTPRQAQAHQLKTWLLFFEHILSNYFAKAGHLGRLFQMALDEESHFPEGSLADVPEWAASFLPIQQQAVETGDAATLKALRRLERLLAHLMARFGHELKYFPDALSANASEYSRLKARVGKMLAFYRDLPTITKRRGQGMDAFQSVTAASTPGGLKTRIARLLGLRPDDPDLTQYASVEAALSQVDFVMVEHILLRPIARDYAHDNMLFRFRDGKISKIIRLRSRLHPDSYRFKCYSTGTASLKPEDRIEITFSTGFIKGEFTILEVAQEYFIIAVSKELATAMGNLQGGSWNKISDAGSVLYADPWSLQITYLFPAYDPRYSDSYHREYVEQLLRQETPAHIAIHILWLDFLDMSALYNQYFHWRKAYAQYLYDQQKNEEGENSYVSLRHYRNALIRLIIAGETDPILDLPITLVPSDGITDTLDKEKGWLITVPKAKKVDLTFELAEVEEGITYSLVKPTTPNSWEDYETVPGQLSLTEKGIQIKLAKANYPAGESDFAVLAWAANEQVGNLLHQKIKITVV